MYELKIVDEENKMIIAFMGIDGSGKTTLSKALYDKLKQQGIDVLYKEEFKYFLLKYIFNLFGSRRVELLRKKFLEERRPLFYFRIWPFLIFLDFFVEWVYIRLFERKKIIIKDRYIYDFQVGWEWLGYSNRFVKWLYLHFPKPDIIFICDVDPDFACKRKGINDKGFLDFLRIQRKRYSKLAEELDIQVINTEKPKEEIIDELINKILPISPKVSEEKLNQIKIFFSKRAKKHEKEIPSHLFEKIWKLVSEYANEKDDKELMILDCGCGAGAWTRKFKEKDVKVIGLDISDKMLNLAKSIDPFGSYIRGDLFDLPFKNNSFDVAFLGYVLHHFSKKEITSLLKEVYRIIKPGGIVISIDPNLYNPYNFFEIHPKSPFRDNLNHIPEERPLSPGELKDCYIDSGFNKTHIYTFSFIPSRKIETSNGLIRKILVSFDKFLDKFPIIKYLGSNVVCKGEKREN